MNTEDPELMGGGAKKDNRDHLQFLGKAHLYDFVGKRKLKGTILKLLCSIFISDQSNDHLYIFTLH